MKRVFTASIWDGGRKICDLPADSTLLIRGTKTFVTASSGKAAKTLGVAVGVPYEITRGGPVPLSR